MSCATKHPSHAQELARTPQQANTFAPHSALRASRRSWGAASFGDIPGNPAVLLDTESGALTPCPVAWPIGPALGGRLIVLLNCLEDASQRVWKSHLWWLQLSRDGDAIVGAERAIVPEAPGPGHVLPQELCPVIGEALREAWFGK